jgi:hypothetical protein
MAFQVTSDPQAAGQPLYTSQAYANNNPPHQLGERLVTTNGRVFRYCKVGSGADLIAGNFIQSPAQIANHQNLAVTATFAIGVSEISVTLGGTAATLNQYAGGQAVVTVTPGLGQALNIIGNPAQATTNGTLTLTLAEPLRVALSTSTRIDLIPNPYNGVIQTPVTTLTGCVVGVATYIIAASEYGWIQRSGPCGALIAGTPGVGLAIVCPGTAAGAAVVDGAASETYVVGTMLSTGGNGECNGVMLALE